MIRKKVKISQNLMIGPPPTEESLRELADKGFKTIVNLCIKGEFDQVWSPDQEGEKVQSLGLQYLHIPVSMKSMSHSQVDELCEQLSDEMQPVYIHCRLGQRSIPFSLLYYAREKGLSLKRLMTKAAKLGLSWDAPFLQTFVQSYFERDAELAA
ncbi:MAG: phosphatase [Myxococcales bacterium]|nr:phosphatase [Myxococcales bacterium]